MVNDLIFYSQGDVELVRADLEVTLPPPVYEEAMRFLAEQGLHAAYDSRRELVNFKKVTVSPARTDRCQYRILSSVQSLSPGSQGPSAKSWRNHICRSDWRPQMVC